ncbi:hypothetical protein [Streptosporangium longisporum]|uniref:Nucleotide exchange factor GrpE n=1 Tax=Streptosporangium longisporum TaxID=46187 RepID=A0ABP6KFW4_9ACTN
MTSQPGNDGDPIERGGSEEATGTPLTPTEVETSRRPAGATPGVTPAGPEASEGQAESDAEFERRKELNPDDFE